MNQFVVLADGVAVYALDVDVTQASAYGLREQLKELLPGWRVVVLGRTALIDQRGDAELTRLALELRDRVAALPPA